MIFPLHPPIPVETPRGSGVAAFLIDYGPEFDLYWVTFLHSSHECFTFHNRDVLSQVATPDRPSPRRPRAA